MVLNDVNLELESGAVYGLLGKNGSGKTMLMRAICGLIRPTGGSIEIGGQIIGKDLSFPRSVGMILETPVFLPDKTGFENLRLLASIRGEIGPREIKAALERVGLDPEDPRKVKKYSLGMRQRLGIAQAVMEDPEVLILDEPFNGLDKTTAEDMRGLLLELRDRGKAILLASHNARDIEELCGWVYEMDVHRS